MKIPAILVTCAVFGLAASCGSEEGASTEPAAGPRISEAETGSWGEARSANTKEAYTQYVSDYPNGEYKDEAAAWLRILELKPIKLNIQIAAPEGQFMKAAPPVMNSEGELVPSMGVSEIPAGTTFTMEFDATVDGEEIASTLVAVFDEKIGDRLVFRNEDGLCVWRNPASNGLGYCEDSVPPPPDPSDTVGLMHYAWLTRFLDEQAARD